MKICRDFGDLYEFSIETSNHNQSSDIKIEKFTNVRENAFDSKELLIAMEYQALVKEWPLFGWRLH